MIGKFVRKASLRRRRELPQYITETELSISSGGRLIANDLDNDQPIWDYIHLATTRRGQLNAFDLNTILPRNVGRPSKALARLYSHMMSDAGDGTSMMHRCVANAEACDEWLELVIEMLTNLPLMPAVSQTIVSILAGKLPDHPVSKIVNFDKVTILRAYDAVDDGTNIRLTLDSDTSFRDARAICLMSIDDPVSCWAACSIEKQVDRSLRIAVDRDAPLFAEGRYVLPPAVLVMEGC